MKKPKSRPFPWAPLGDAAGNPSIRSLRTTLRDEFRVIKLAMAEGLTIDQADRWAERLGFHPAEVWSNWVDVILAEDAPQRELFEVGA